MQRLPVERADCEACNVEHADGKALDIAHPDEKVEKVSALSAGIGEKRQRSLSLSLTL